MYTPGFQCRKSLLFGQGPRQRKDAATTLLTPPTSNIGVRSTCRFARHRPPRDAADDWEGDGEHTDTQVLGCQVFGYLAYGCSFLFVCLVLFLRKQIALANGIIKVLIYSLQNP